MGLGFDPLELPADRFFNWMWSLMMRNREEKDRNRLAGELYMPLPNQDIEFDDDITDGPWSSSSMAESFRALHSEVGGVAR